MTTYSPGVSTATFYERSNHHLASLRARADALQASISTGQKLTKGSDDPIAAARLRLLGRADASALIDTSLSAAATTDLSLTDDTLTSFGDAVIRIKELAVQAANGSIAPAQRTVIAAEIDQIRDTLFQMANTSDSAGHALFGGENTGAAYTLSAGGLPVYVGTAAASDVPLGDGQTVTRGITGPQFLNFSVNGSPADLFAVAKTLSDALKGAVADPAQAARDSLGSLDAGLEAISTQQTVVGARLNWLDLTTQRREQTGLLRSQDEADTGGTDLSLAVSTLQQTMTVLEASQASFARLSQLSLFALLR